ncbi:hypothetical protein SASPL_147314 [Salvia splendens]|uniref:Myb/SANT-like domain-containing protein n=1 Tax=Salvia splendens TaxID=180675 RepID=A0A8X8WFD4_SALSN|nr:hypothetical protein SASPL_147314 [Salvia splendens]
MANGDRTLRNWTNREEEILVLAVRELVVNGWKSDNGFRSRYLFKLEDALKQQFPISDIRISPHIHSKIIVWEKIYSSLRDILGRSGVGFNANNDYKIECNDNQWYQIVKNPFFFSRIWRSIVILFLSPVLAFLRKILSFRQLLQNRHSPPIPLYCSLTDRPSAMQRSRRFALSLSPSSSLITNPWSGHGAAPSVGFGQVQPLLGLFPCRCSYRLTARCCQLHRWTAAAGAVQPGKPAALVASPSPVVSEAAPRP